ncbi:MAG TPA: aminotransferase class V-fold PLP-dependent enzyme [Vicinamibacteria bacterium]|nr:aminotransferase class V-fold PLP-dependent enzyme [Vicinamibacteria bacterium]
MKTSDRVHRHRPVAVERPIGGMPEREMMTAATRKLHEAVDARIRRHRCAFLHPHGESVPTDLLGSQTMVDWQEEKARRSFLGEACWSSLPPVYARYGSRSSQRLLARVKNLENATSVVLTDSGMQACALLMDVLFEPHTEAVVARGSYNKTKTYLKRLAERQGGQVRLVEEASQLELERALTDKTRIVFVETYSNPLMRAVDVPGLVERIAGARKGNPGLHLIVDNTIATPWGTKAPLLDWGVDFVVASGTKALDGRDRNLWGYIASHRAREMNDVMDLQAMRGGILDWRRAEDIESELDEARGRFERRCEAATEVAAFLERHPQVSEVHHPSLPNHRDAAIVRRDYRLPGSLVSFRLHDADESSTRHFCDVLAMTRVPRYALSFDGLVTKVNHHRTVSEYFTPEKEVRDMGVDRLVRLGIGLEATDDLIDCLEWALLNFRQISAERVASFQSERRRELRLIDREGEEDP